jgi:hypothetical protein
MVVGFLLQPCGPPLAQIIATIRKTQEQPASTSPVVASHWGRHSLTYHLVSEFSGCRYRANGYLQVEGGLEESTHLVRKALTQEDEPTTCLLSDNRRYTFSPSVWRTRGLQSVVAMIVTNLVNCESDKNSSTVGCVHRLVR